MSSPVFFTKAATQDLQTLYDYISRDSKVKANKVIDKLEEACSRLKKFPEQRSYPKELITLGIREYREINIKPYRIIYRVVKEVVYIYLIVDGKRDMKTLLEQRLFTL